MSGQCHTEKEIATPADNQETEVQELRKIISEQQALILSLLDKGPLATELSSESEAEKNNHPPLSQRAQTLKSVQRDGRVLNVDLQRQLGEIREQKKNLEQTLNSGVEQRQRALRCLQQSLKSGGEQSVGRELVQALQEQVVAQQEEIKKLESALKKLSFNLDVERGRVNILRHENQALKQKTVDMQASVEKEEEFISNRLLKRISGLKREKGQLLVQVEQEEEYLTNMLQRKLAQIQQEKIDLENALEQEQEFIVNRLQKQLDALRTQQQVNCQAEATPSSSLVAGNTPPANPRRLSQSHIASEVNISSSGMVEVLKAEINSLRTRISEMEKEYMAKFNQVAAYRKDLVELRTKLGIDTEDLVVEESIPGCIRPASTPARRPTRRSMSGSKPPTLRISSSTLVASPHPSFPSPHPSDLSIHQAEETGKEN